MALLASPASAEVVSRCPEDTVAVQTVDPRRPWACALQGESYMDGTNCPSGYEAVSTANTYDPFKCAKKGITVQAPRGVCPPNHKPVPTSDPDRDYECRKNEPGFVTGPSCPRGTLPIPTPGALRPFRCVRQERPSDAEPAAQPVFKGKVRGEPASSPGEPIKGVCPKGTRKVQTENPFSPVQCVSTKAEKPGKAPLKRTFEVQGSMSFEYPGSWNLTDAWKDEIPSAFLLKDSGGDGRPVSLTVSSHKPGQADYQPMKTAIRREKDWHGAVDAGVGEVDGLPAIFLKVPEESDTAFVETADGYYVISFSSPKYLYAQEAPAFKRVLESFRHERPKKQKPKP